MNLEEKVGLCVKDYRRITEKQLRGRQSGSNWRLVTDRELFGRSIFCSAPCGEEWGGEEYPKVIDVLKEIVKPAAVGGQCYIGECLDHPGKSVTNEAVFLCLAYIAFWGDRKQRPFIKAITDIVCYKKTGEDVDDGELDRLSKQLGKAWLDKIINIFGKHFGFFEKYKVILMGIYEVHKNFIDNYKHMNAFDAARLFDNND